MTPSEAWNARHTDSRAALLAMLEICHAHAQNQAINTTPAGRAAMKAMNAARVAIAIIETTEEPTT